MSINQSIINQTNFHHRANSMAGVGPSAGAAPREPQQQGEKEDEEIVRDHSLTMMHTFSYFYKEDSFGRPHARTHSGAGNEFSFSRRYNLDVKILEPHKSRCGPISVASPSAATRLVGTEHRRAQRANHRPGGQSLAPSRHGEPFKKNLYLDYARHKQ